MITWAEPMLRSHKLYQLSNFPQLVQVIHIQHAQPQARHVLTPLLLILDPVPLPLMVPI